VDVTFQERGYKEYYFHSKFPVYVLSKSSGKRSGSGGFSRNPDETGSKALRNL